MTRRPFDPGELGATGPDADLEHVASELEGYARLTATETPRRLGDRVMAAIASEPPPRRGLIGTLIAPFAAARHSNVGRAVMVAGTMALAILVVLAAGGLAELFRTDQVGPSPEPTVSESPLVTPSPTPEASPAPSVTPAATSTSSPSPSALESSGTTAEPSESETPRPATPRATETPEQETETPRPSDGNSGPGGGGGGSDGD